MFANFTSTTSTLDPFAPRGGIYGVFIKYENLPVQKPSVLYQTTTSVNFTAFDCDIAYSSIGQTCIGTMIPNLVNSIQRSYYVKVDFLSKGSVFQNKAITIDMPNTIYNAVQLLMPLPFGGQLLLIEYNDGTTKVNGSIIDDNGNLIPWGLQNPVPIGQTNVIILSNNTLVISEPEGANSWSLLSTDLPKVAGGT